MTTGMLLQVHPTAARAVPAPPPPVLRTGLLNDSEAHYGTLPRMQGFLMKPDAIVRINNVNRASEQV